MAVEPEDIEDEEGRVSLAVTSRSRTAAVNHNLDGDPIGAALFLNDEELGELGIDVDSADTISYFVRDGELEIKE